MKALENDCTIYVEQILAKTKSCYFKSENPSNSDLTELYCFIGKSICQQGEKAFVVYLAEIFAEKLPKLKGFSPRNLRRMRDFYKTYENQPELMIKAQALSWTQNTVILEYCKTNEQREFYITLASEKNISKLALIKAIETNTNRAIREKETTQSTAEIIAPVRDASDEKVIHTSKTTKTMCGAFVTACEPLPQSYYNKVLIFAHSGCLSFSFLPAWKYADTS